MKNMKKKIVFLVLPLFLGMTLASCGGKNNPPKEHVHHYDCYTCDDMYHYQVCTECGESTPKEMHHGGQASCQERAICEVCHQAYGSLEEHQFGPWQYVDGEDTHFHVCSICNEKETGKHVFNIEKQLDECLVGEKDEDCEGENTYYKSCVCGAHSHSLEETFVLPNSHDYSLEIVLDNEANKISEATCTEAAQYGLVCSHNHEHFDHEHTFSYGEPKGHSYGDLIPEVRTFSMYNAGYYQCSECGHFFIDVGEGGDHVYKEVTYDDIYDETKTLYRDPNYGTLENPYILSCKEDILFLRDLVNKGTDTFAGKYLVLGNDIDFAFKEGEYFGSPIGYSNTNKFQGHFDGANHTIKGLSIHGTKDHEEGELPGDSLALFSRVSGATIENIKFENALIDGDSQRNAVCVALATDSTIRNIEVVSGIVKGTTECGGVVGAIDKTSGTVVIEQCINRAYVQTLSSNYGCSGGIVGATVASNGTKVEIRNNKNYGEINGNGATTLSYVGGIIGLVRETVEGGSFLMEGCLNFGSVHATKLSLGGVVGSLRAGTVKDCFCYEEANIYSGPNGEYHPTAVIGKQNDVDASHQTGYIVGEIKKGSVVELINSCVCDVDGIPAHKMEDGQPWNQEATCYQKGYDDYWVCSLCHTIHGEEIEKLEHHMEYVCTEETHQYKCTNEGCHEGEEAEPHTFVKDENRSIEPTDSADGLYYYVCSVCHYEKTVVVPRNCDHQGLQHVLGTAPTCHTVGEKEHYHCPVCEKDFLDENATQPVGQEDLVLPVVGHNFVKHDPINTYADTTVEYYTCSFKDHDVSEGEYFVKQNDEYVATTYDELIVPGPRGSDEYGSEEKPYVLSSVEDLLAFRDDVNYETEVVDGATQKIPGSNDTFAGKYVKLGADIDVTGIDVGSCIGAEDSSPFSGTFDGDNHVIRGLKHSGKDALALFSRVTNGVIKNVKLADVDITTTTQRSAGIVARMENTTIENCHVLSGTITGVKQNGGIAGVSVGSSNIIKNCSNAASVTATASGNGNSGILGYVYSGDGSSGKPFGGVTIESCINTGTITGKNEGTAGILGHGDKTALTVTVDKCINRGDINGAAHGTGGIFGAFTDNGTPTLIISECENYGSISGTNHVGGVAGLPRACSTDSKIINCKNYGNVSGTGTYVGGVVSRARLAVIDCGCLSTVTLTAGSVSKLASECLDTGLGTSANPGFICTVLDTSGNYHGSVSGGYRFDE